MSSVARTAVVPELVDYDSTRVLLRSYICLEESCLDAGFMSCTAVALWYIRMTLLNYLSENFSSQHIPVRGGQGRYTVCDLEGEHEAASLSFS